MERRIYILIVLLLGGLGLWFPNASSQEEPATVRFVQRGDNFAAKGRLDLAVEEYEKAMAAGAGSAFFLNRLGGFYFKKGELEKSLEVLQRSLREKPGQIAVYTQIGEVFLVSGRPDSAIYYAEQARKLAPESSSVIAQLGIFYLQAGFHKQARAYLDTALALDPRNPEAHRFLGFYFTRTDSLDLAIEQYYEVINVLPDDIEAHNNIAFLYALQAKYAESLDFYERTKILSRDPQLNHAINLRTDAIRAIVDGKMRARFVLVKTLREARDLLGRIEQGEDFGEIAKNFSLAPNAADGGDLGFFGPGELLDVFEKAVLQLKVGELSGPLEVPMGVMIIQRLN